MRFDWVGSGAVSTLIAARKDGLSLSEAAKIIAEKHGKLFSIGRLSQVLKAMRDQCAVAQNEQILKEQNDN